jgi:transposase
MKYQNIFGVDTGKYEIVVALHGDKKTKSFPNNDEGFLEFYKLYVDLLPTSMIVVEATGGYERDFQSFLNANNIASHKASGRHIKNFIRSYGLQAKTDVIDAKAIAQYGFERQASLRLYEEKPDSQQRLTSLILRRADLIQMLVAEKNRKQAPSNRMIKDGIGRVIACIEAEITCLDGEIAHCIELDDALKTAHRIVMEVDGIGVKTASSLLALVPELGTVNRREIASLCGVAPHPKQSGSHRGYSRTVGGRRYVRPMLYLSAMAAARSKGRLGIWYRDLVARGKKPLVALVALMRKIIVIANAKVKEARNTLKVETT